MPTMKIALNLHTPVTLSWLSAYVLKVVQRYIHIDIYNNSEIHANIQTLGYLYAFLGTPISYPSRTSVGDPSQPRFPPVDNIYLQSALR